MLFAHCSAEPRNNLKIDTIWVTGKTVNCDIKFNSVGVIFLKEKMRKNGSKKLPKIVSKMLQSVESSLVAALLATQFMQLTGWIKHLKRTVHFCNNWQVIRLDGYPICPVTVSSVDTVGGVWRGTLGWRDVSDKCGVGRWDWGSKLKWMITLFIHGKKY